MSYSGYKFKRLLPSSDKVVEIAFHAELPLLATFDRRNYLTVWDYDRGEPVFECQFGSDSLFNQDAHDALARAEANPDHFGRKLHGYMVAHYLQPAVYGRLRGLEFVDLDTLCWAVAAQRVMTEGPAAALPRVAHVSGLLGRRLLLVTADRAALLLDIVSKQVVTIPASHPRLGGKPLRAAAVLPRDEAGDLAAAPRLAVASADGSVTIFADLAGDAVAGVFATGSKADVTVMAVAPIHGRDALFVGDESGAVFLFDPHFRIRAAVGKDGTARALQTMTFHKAAIVSITFAPGPDPAAPKPRLVTASACGRVGIWDLSCTSNWGAIALIGKVRVRDFKLTGAAAVHSGVFQPGEPSVLLSGNDAKVYGLSLDRNMTRPVCDLAANLPPREKQKGAKLYGVAAALLRPAVVAVASNAGVALLASPVDPTHSFCALPAAAGPLPAEAGDLLGMGMVSLAGVDAGAGEEGSEGEGGEGAGAAAGASMTVMQVLANRLVGASFTAREAPAPGADSGGGDDTMATPLVVKQTARHIVADLGAEPIPAPIAVACNARGTLLSITSSMLDHYVVAASSRSRGVAKWHPLERGRGSGVAWHQTDDAIAVRVVPAAPAAPLEAARGRGSRGSEMPLPASLEPAPPYVTIRLLADHSGGESTTAVERVALPPGLRPTSVHGGVLLGVTLLARGAATETLNFFNWDGSQTRVTDLPAPSLVSWSPSGGLAALAYPDAIQLYALSATFTPVTRVAADHPTSALWRGNILYVSSPSTITAHYVIPPAPEGSRLTRATTLFTQSGATAGLPELSSLPSAAVYEVQSVQVATTQVSRGRALTEAAGSSGLPPLCPRPGALWRLLRVTADAVWMCSPHGHAWAASLRHPGLRTRALAARGDLRGARRLAAAELHYSHHDALARFMCAVGADGAAEALLLPGLSLDLELELAIKCGALPRALACLSALLAGCSSRTLLAAFPVWRGRDVNPDGEDAAAADAAAAGKGKGADPFADAAAAAGGAGGPNPTNLADDVVAVFRQAAGVAAPAVLARLTNFGVQGRAAPLDATLFSARPEGDTPKAAAKPPPPSAKYKSVFPRKDADAAAATPPPGDGGSAPLLVIEADAVATGDDFEDVVDWNWPLRPPPPAAPAPAVATEEDEGGEEVPENGADGGEATNGHKGSGGGGEGGPVQEPAPAPAAPAPLRHSANVAPMTLELGLRLLDAAVMFADAATLTTAIRLLAPLTPRMNASQQARLVAAIGAAGLAAQLSDLTLSGTTPLLPSAAMLGGFLAGDARVTARVLERAGFTPLQALFAQSCGAGGVEASVAWETALRGIMGGPTRELTITPQTS